MIKKKITKLQEQYNVVKKCLKVIGAGFPMEKAIWAKLKLQNIYRILLNILAFTFINFEILLTTIYLYIIM